MMSTATVPGRARSNAFDALTDISLLHPDARGEALGEFFAARTQTIRSIARTLVVKFHLNPTQDLDEVTGMVFEVAYEKARDFVNNPGLMQGLTTFEAHITVSCYNTVRAFAQSQHSHGSTGLSSQHRRYGYLMAERTRLANILQRTPTDVEVVESHNERMRRVRKDAERQGVIATVDDLKWPYQALDDIGARAGDSAVVGDGDGPLAAADLPRLRREVVAYLQGSGKVDAAALAGWWLDEFDADGGQGMAPKAQMAKQCGLSRTKLGLLLPVVHDAVRHVLETSFGITADDI